MLERASWQRRRASDDVVHPAPPPAARCGCGPARLSRRCTAVVNDGRVVGAARHAGRLQDALEGQVAIGHRAQHRAPHAAQQLAERGRACQG